MGYSIHFKADNEQDSKRKVLRLQTGKKYSELDKVLKNTSSDKLKSMLDVSCYSQLREEAEAYQQSINSYALQKIQKATKDQISLFSGIEGTYRGETDDFFHQLFPYLEAFSPKFVRSLTENYSPDAQILLDPFGGLGTAPFTFSNHSKKAYYCEINPLMQHIATLKKELKQASIKDRKDLLAKTPQIKADISISLSKYTPDSSLNESYIKAFKGSDFFTNLTLDQLLRLRSFLDKLYCKDRLLAVCLELSILASIVPASNMQRAGDLRKKRPNERLRSTDDIVPHIVRKLTFIEEGLFSYQSSKYSPLLICEDARNLRQIPSIEADIIVTSPPYLNGTNYFRNTKLELWFIGVLKDSSDLGRLRDKAITAGINDVRGLRSKSDPELEPFISLTKCISDLESCAYDRRIIQMVKWYAHDLSQALSGAVSQLRMGGIVAVDIGDSVYSGVKVPTDLIVKEILARIGCDFIDSIVVRQRKSRSGVDVKQVCIVARKARSAEPVSNSASNLQWLEPWNRFKEDLPHVNKPFSSRNWGHINHSMCSYQGKLKPSIAKFLIESFVPPGGSVLDPFSGVGTIPFEAALSGKTAFGFDISPAAVAISRAKVWRPEADKVDKYISSLTAHINRRRDRVSVDQWLPNFNKHLSEYYEKETLKEILCAREWFLSKKPWDAPLSLMLACCMHILHGNRPYALSRRSHPVTPFAPSGEFEYKSIIDKLSVKVHKSISADYPESFVEGDIFFQDATSHWPLSISNLDAIVTSPPFYDSTRFHLANWIRLWFSGWGKEDFAHEQKRFIDERQKQSFDCYRSILRQSKERLKEGGVLVFHLGKSNKCVMSEEIAKIAKFWFSKHEIFNESVSHCESHGMRDKGTVTDHQYLVLY